MACSVRCTFVALSLVGFGRFEPLWNDWACEEKSRLDKRVSSLTSQQDTYLRELQKVYASLQEN
ncbi:hypothetical protein RYX36_028192 [Vicia faba]